MVPGEEEEPDGVDSPSGLVRSSLHSAHASFPGKNPPMPLPDIVELKGVDN